MELLAGLVRSRLVCDGIAIVRRQRDRVTLFRPSGQQPKAKPLGGSEGLAMELLAGLEPATC